MSEYSREALLEFLDYLAAKGLANKNTTASRKTSVVNMLSILDDDEARDIRDLDMDDVTARFTNIHAKKYSPDSLRVYKSRVATALDDFVRFKENPAAFRMAGSVKAHSKPSDAKALKRGAPAERSLVASAKQITFGNIDGLATSPTKNTINVPISLRGSCVVTINGLPMDLTDSEARKIANVVMAMANTEEA
jgi:hypothetical protein